MMNATDGNTELSWKGVCFQQQCSDSEAGLISSFNSSLRLDCPPPCFLDFVIFHFDLVEFRGVLIAFDTPIRCSMDTSTSSMSADYCGPRMLSSRMDIDTGQNQEYLSITYDSNTVGSWPSDTGNNTPPVVWHANNTTVWPERWGYDTITNEDDRFFFEFVNYYMLVGWVILVASTLLYCITEKCRKTTEQRLHQTKTLLLGTVWGRRRNLIAHWHNYHH
jgi:hypothetical protein